MGVTSDAIHVLKLANEILNGCNEVYEIAKRTKQKCDDFHVSGIRDESFQKVYQSLEIASSGYEDVAPYLNASGEAMKGFADRILAGHAIIMNPSAPVAAKND